MKFFITFSLAILLLAQGVYAQKGKSAPAPAETVLRLKNGEDSIQYALGAYMANYLIKGGFSKINLDLFLVGLNDVYRKKPRIISDSIGYQMLARYQEETSDKRNRFLEQQLFETLKANPNVGKLPSGVQFLVIKPGSGRRPQETDTVTIHYKGMLPTGDVFENTFVNNTPITTTPNYLIDGLRQVLPLMPEGATYEIFIPSALAYGDKGNNRIPPNSALLITIELISIKK